MDHSHFLYQDFYIFRYNFVAKTYFLTQIYVLQIGDSKEPYQRDFESLFYGPMFLHCLWGFILTLVFYVNLLSVLLRFAIIFKRKRKKLAGLSSLSCDC